MCNTKPIIERAALSNRTIERITLLTTLPALLEKNRSGDIRPTHLPTVRSYLPVFVLNGLLSILQVSSWSLAGGHRPASVGQWPTCRRTHSEATACKETTWLS